MQQRPGEQQYFALRAMFPHFNRQLNPGQPRHHDVGDKQVRSLAKSGLQSVKRFGEGGGFEALVAQDHGQCRSDDVLVVNDEDAVMIARLGHDIPLFKQPCNQSATDKCRQVEQ
jgi:hypothetical protein